MSKVMQEAAEKKEMTEEEFTALSREVIGAISTIKKALEKHGITGGANVILFVDDYWCFNPYDSSWELSKQDNCEKAMVINMNEPFQLALIDAEA